MTENKRFIRIVDHLEKEVRIYDTINEKKIFNIFFNELDSTICLNGALTDTVDLLNELSDENEQLKEKYNEQSVQYEGLEEQVERLLDFKDNVFNLINAKIKHYEHKPFSAPVGQPMSVNFDADMDRIARLSELQQLKKELIE